MKHRNKLEATAKIQMKNDSGLDQSYSTGYAEK